MTWYWNNLAPIYTFIVFLETYQSSYGQANLDCFVQLWRSVKNNLVQRKLDIYIKCILLPQYNTLKIFVSYHFNENGEIYMNNKWMDAAVMGENNNDKCDALCNRVRPHTYWSTW